ncbi:hypothetical protein PCLA_06r0467 [Pseudomonas citronellolis]|nr:hypothetical protein PCLA_06r0467 [Pseudomonas citronellolis]
MLNPAANCRLSQVHVSTDLRNAQALVFDHLDDLQLEAGIECSAFTAHE